VFDPVHERIAKENQRAGQTQDPFLGADLVWWYQR
jgi:hypothetical protein